MNKDDMLKLKGQRIAVKDGIGFREFKVTEFTEGMELVKLEYPGMEYGVEVIFYNWVPSSFLNQKLYKITKT